LERASQLLGLETADCRRLLVTLAGLHDIGKFAPSFQAKVPIHWPSDVLGPLALSRASVSRHTDDGYRLWHHVLAEKIGDRLWSGNRAALDVLAFAIFGHHGRPISPSRLHEQPAAWAFGDIALPIALSCTSDVVDLISAGPVTARSPDVNRVRLASWWVAGLLTVADWIGSREQWFPYVGDDHGLDLDAYWRRANVAAATAVRAEGLVATTIAPTRTFAELIGASYDPTPAQRWATSVDVPTGPALFILEDVTGAGKTEAAQMLVHRLMRAGHSAGAYWAMPTQATANAMYGRQAATIDGLFARGTDVQPSLVLSHGQTRLHEGFRDTVIKPLLREAASDLLNGDETQPSTVLCAEFFANDRRAALLADVGAGTIDQALLAVLPSRFNTMRLFGLSDKTLIIDEAHAYDAYMSVELETLLCAQAALGGSAIVLSATLPRKKRADLVAAWLRGLAGGRRLAAPRLGTAVRETADIRANAYPLATVVARDVDGPVVREQALDAAPWSHRELPVRFVDSVGAAMERVVDAARRGAAVVWIRNTVSDCLTAAAVLEEHGIEPLVFHARFAQCDRQFRENEVIRLFGQTATAEERRGRVLVATQVVEQSLDLDFDVMVSDLAPVDLLIQRAGRLQRHPMRDGTRPPGITCELIVLAPSIAGAIDVGWIKTLLPGTAAVYENTGVLWRTACVLSEVGSIATPHGLRGLIEAVYGSSDESDVPEALQRATNLAEGGEHGASSIGHQVVLDIADGYRGDGKDWMDDMRVPTRLGRPQTTLRLARAAKDGALLPWAGELRGPPWKAWALSEVRVSAGRVPMDAGVDPRYRSAVEAIRLSWTRFEQDTPVVPLVEIGTGEWQGVLTAPGRKKPIQMAYTTARGLDIR
jgi:CRISPR-associated endonuclease/helicase Cas3